MVSKEEEVFSKSVSWAISKQGHSICKDIEGIYTIIYSTEYQETFQIIMAARQVDRRLLSRSHINKSLI